VHTKIRVTELRRGMFVAELDRPWEESPFLLQGFRVDSEDDIAQLQACCEHVYIDPARSEGLPMAFGRSVSARPVVETTRATVERAARREPALDRAPLDDALDGAPAGPAEACITRIRGNPGAGRVHASRSPRELHALLDLPGEFVEYRDLKPVEEEMPTAREVQSELKAAVERSLERLRNHEALEVGEIDSATGALVESMVRNADASYLLLQLREKDPSAYFHSIDAAVLAVLFGRHMGLSPAQLKTLAMGVQLLDVGKIRLPRALLSKKGALSSDEVRLLKRHVALSLQILRESGVTDMEILAIVADHHERMDGSGYPRGKKGNEIPVFARIAAIIDFYDAVTHPRPYRRALRSSQAVNALYERRGSHFQRELVEEFIQCLGVYPTGTLVLLSTGEVGIVIAQNRIRRLRPKVLVVRDADKRPVEVPFPRDLEVELVDGEGRRLFIQTALDPGAYDISPEDFYL